MKPIRTSLLLLVLAPLLVAACDELRITTFPVDDRPLPAWVASLYEEDAARLALRHVAGTRDLALEPAAIPADLRTSLYRALVRVYNARHDAAEQVAAIHTFPDPELRRLLVRFDLAAPWADAWREGRTHTGNAQLDALLQQYDLELERLYDWSFGTYAVLKAVGEPLNLQRVARELLRVPGILDAEPDGACCDGSDITAQRTGGGWVLTYYARWGDCPAGCIEEHWWRFNVSADGTVRFLGSGGSERPRW